MKYPLFKILSLSALLTTLTQAADTFVLKNGDKIVGDLIRETEDSYVVDVHIAPTIRDEQTVLKSNVLRVLKPEAGLAEFKQLEGLAPAPDGLRVGDYKQRIELLTQFIEKFPSSPNVRKAMDIRVELRDEMRLVEEGALKIDGVLYPAAQQQENEYELDARIEARKIKDLAISGNQLEALRAYNAFQQEYAYTKVHLELIPVIQKLISAQAAQATEWRDTLTFRIAERQKGLDSMTPSDRQNSERAILVEEENLRRRYRMETSSQLGWVMLHPFCKESLDYTIAFSKAELRKIDAFLAKDFIDCGAIYRELYQMSKQGADEKALKEKMRAFSKTGIPKRYLEKFTLASGGR